MPTNLEKLRAKLAELFQLDQADLDFGIYRIMNSKREEILRFLDKDLLPQVQSALAKYKDSGASTLTAELTALEGRLKNDGVEPSQSKKYQELAAKLEEARKGGLSDAGSLEQEVFSDLYNFFSRYYDEGDFLSLRRYKAGVYAVPYEGEEVYLHWANKDQYYIKTSEYLRDYTFKLSDGRRVHFKLVEATTEAENRKEQAGQERRFILDSDEPLAEVEDELFVRFHYKVPSGEKKKQAELNAKAVETILASKKYSSWIASLSRAEPTDGNPHRSLLEKHLLAYTARNTFDYFIHKDLGGFLRRELDFFIKNEVMHLDDVESDTAPRVEQYLSKLRVLRAIAGKIIAFLEQLETFQRRLWLKQKLVIETNYCVSLDQVPDDLLPEVARNASQVQEWVDLYAVGDMKGDLVSKAFTTPPTAAFLRDNRNLLIDTRHFDRAFVDRLLAGRDDLDRSTSGLLIHGDNFQALKLLTKRLTAQLPCIYIDPPYNTDAGPIVYKNGYRSSSWVTMMENRLELASELLADDGVICVTIDDYQVHELGLLLDGIFERQNQLGVSVIRINPSGRSTVSGFSVCHEYAFFYGRTGSAKLKRIPRTAEQLDRFVQEGGIHVDWRNFRKDGGAVTHRTERPKQYYPLYVDALAKSIRIPEMSWDKVARSWTVLETPHKKEVIVWPIDENGKERVWSLNHESARDSLKDLEVRQNKNGEIQVYRRHIPSDGVLPRSWWDKNTYAAREHGSAALTNLFGQSSVFSFAKAPAAVQDCVWISGLDGESDATVLDFFAGSGTTGEAVISQNREHGGSRKFILVEAEAYFDDVTKPRVCKSLYSPKWKDGKPQVRDSGVSAFVKYVRLESYEDSLNNLAVQRTSGQDGLLSMNDSVREDYTLRYMLDVEARASLLKIDQFSDPYAYTLKVHRNGEAKEVAVDLVETFNWLLGLTVKSIGVVRNVRVVEGTNPEGQKVLVLWRKTVGKDAVDNDALNKWFEKSQYSTKDREFDFIYVNGDNHLENIRTSPEHVEATWKVRLIEQEFQRLMFEGAE